MRGPGAGQCCVSVARVGEWDRQWEKMTAWTAATGWVGGWVCNTCTVTGDGWLRSQQASLMLALLSVCLPVSLCVSPPQLALCVLDEVCIAYILARVLGGLAYLHDAGRLHRCVWVCVGV